MRETRPASTLLELLWSAPGKDVAVVWAETGDRVTYGSLREQVMSVAEALAGYGIGRGDRVAMALPNGLATVVCFLAASVAGTAAPLNPGYRYEEFCFYLEDTAAKVLIVPPERAGEAGRAAADRGVLLLTAETSGGAVRVAAPRCASPSEPAPEDTALVLHTSGSTGRPKRVPLKHRHLAVSIRNVVSSYELSSADVSLCLMPLFHVHGLVASTLATLLTGGTVVVPSRFNPLSFWRLVRDHRVTWYSAVPTIHQLIVARLGGGSEKPAGAGAESLRFVRSCSAALSPELMHKMEAALGVPVLEAYGMTEASHQMASNPLPPATRKPGTVGCGTGVRIRIMEEEGHLPGAGQPGEVLIQGPNVIEGYENNPEANAQSFVEGWFRTGDQGILDEDGYLRLTGRLKELINRGGEKIAPREIDEVLLAHPAIAEALCFGVPHPTWGEEVAAAVVLGQPASESEILAWCRDRLADFKCPKKLYMVESIPRTATGKVQRLNVAATLAEPRR